MMSYVIDFYKARYSCQKLTFLLFDDKPSRADIYRESFEFWIGISRADVFRVQRWDSAGAPAAQLIGDLLQEVSQVVRGLDGCYSLISSDP